MKEIRIKVNEFDKVRSNKEEITSLKIVEKLQSKRKSKVQCFTIFLNAIATTS